MKITIEAENEIEEIVLKKDFEHYKPVVYDNVKEFLLFGLRIRDAKTLAIHHFRWWSGNYEYLLGFGRRFLDSLQKEEFEKGEGGKG